eukprot:Em0001g542a
MEAPLETQINDIMSQPGITGAVCTDKQGLALAAQGTLKPEAAGLIAGLASQAGQLKHGTGRDDIPTVVVEFDTGKILIHSHKNAILAVYKV